MNAIVQLLQVLEADDLIFTFDRALQLGTQDPERGGQVLQKDGKVFFVITSASTASAGRRSVRAQSALQYLDDLLGRASRFGQASGRAGLPRLLHHVGKISIRKNDHRQILVAVTAGVAQVRAEEDRRAIEQRAAAVVGCMQLR